METSSRAQVPSAAAFGLAFATPPLIWWVVGRLDTGPDYLTGPYHVPLGLEIAVGVAAIVAAVGSVIMIVAARSARIARLERTTSIAATLLVMAAGGLAAALWRAVTSGGVGANIGGGIALLFGPVPIVALLVTAVVVESRRRGRARSHIWGRAALTALLAPAMWVVVFTVF